MALNECKSFWCAFLHTHNSGIVIIICENSGLPKAKHSEHVHIVIEAQILNCQTHIFGENEKLESVLTKEVWKNSPHCPFNLFR